PRAVPPVHTFFQATRLPHRGVVNQSLVGPNFAGPVPQRGGPMHLKSVRIKNFRLLDDIDVTFDGKVNVIVGPNASGKTTILDAIRLAKAMLAPRTQNEPNQVLFALGAGSPHMPQRLIGDALARDVTKPLEIRTQYEFTDSELTKLSSTIPQIAADL